MKLSAIPMGFRFKCDGVEYNKTNHNRGVYVINGQQIFKSFNKHKEVEAGVNIFTGKIKCL